MATLTPLQIKKLMSELAKRNEALNKPPYDFLSKVHSKQHNLLFDKSKRCSIVCGRRAGKTSGIKFKMKMVSDLHPGEKQVYIAKTLKYAKQLLWRELVQFFRDELKETDDNLINETKAEIMLYNNTIIMFAGCKDKEEASKIRGHYFSWVYIDEAQDIKKYILEELINDVIVPALTDINGGLWLTGTPNASCSGTLYDTAHGQGKFKNYSKHYWTLHHNDFILKKSGRTGDQIIQDICVERGVDIHDDGIQREFFGRWIRNNERMVYKFDREKNVISKKDFDPNQEWEYILGVDVGYNDADAMVVIAVSRELPCAYIVEEFKKSKQNITSLAERIKKLDKKYQFVKKVIDTGGGGAKIADELRTRHGIAIEAAKKTEKFVYISLMNADFINKRIMVLDSCPYLIDELSTLVREEDGEEGMKPKEDGRFENHLCDAALYAWRFCKNYTYQEKEPEPEHGSDKWADEKAKELEKQMLRNLNNNKRSWYED